MSREKAAFRQFSSVAAKQGLTIRTAWDIKKESALYSRQGCAGYRRLFPGHGGLYAYAIQLQKGRPTGMDTFEKIRALLAEQLDVDPAKITLESDIMSDF